MKASKHLYLAAALIWAAVLSATSFGAKPHDVQTGMDYENAVESVRDCVELASGIDGRKVRPQDTLESVGIWDVFSLTALKRYLVHNEDCGVQRYFGVGEVQIIPRTYYLNEEALDEITTKTTVLELAGIIAKSAGRPFLPHSVAARIVSNCRAQAMIKTGRSGPFDKIDTSVEVWSDLGSSPSAELVDRFSTAFSSCVKGGEFGIGSAGVTYPKHGSRAYLLPEGSDAYVRDLIKGNPKIKYAELLDYVYSNAQDNPPSGRSLAIRRAASVFVEVLLIIGGPNGPAGTRVFRLRDFFSSGVVDAEFKKGPFRALNISNAAFACGVAEFENRRAEEKQKSNRLRIADKTRQRPNPDCRNKQNAPAVLLVNDSMSYDQILTALAAKYQ